MQFVIHRTQPIVPPIDKITIELSPIEASRLLSLIKGGHQFKYTDFYHELKNNLAQVY